MKQEARFRGALLGLAAGDALGATLEFRCPGSFAKLEDMVGGGPFSLSAGMDSGIIHPGDSIEKLS
jgi:ADP-ribosyl-[dinitrogen reductase] hydrolase